MPTKYVVQTTITDAVNVSDQSLVDPPSGATLADGSYTDITVSGTGTVMTIPNGTVTTAKMGGDVTTAGKALLDDADASAQRATLGLGTAATTNSTAYEASGAVSTHAAVTSGVHGISAFGATLVDDADNTAARTTLGLGAVAVNNETAQSARFGLITGQYIDTQHDCTAHTTLAGAANRIDMTPFIPTRTFSIDRIGVNVTTGVASANVKIVIYSADANGWPDTRLYESGDLSAATSSTFVEATMSQTFTAGTIYWVGVRHSSTATLRAMPLASCLPLGLLSTTAAGPATVIRRTLTYATAATTPWVFTNSDRVAGIAPTSIRMRIA